ncbi:MAG: ribonuclease HII [Serratia symbiotica]|nr:ribonuclease HII [Serratia symbiotica]
MIKPFIYRAALLIDGVDEVGRGPLVGAVVTAAVILDPAQPIVGLADSKKLSEKRRLALYEEIIAKALSWSLARLPIVPDMVLIDGNRCPTLPMRSQAVVTDDSRVAEISAASILAKVTRDREMIELDRVFPGYGFTQYKGYSTAFHLEQLAVLGATEHHRRSFAPVRRVLEL